MKSIVVGYDGSEGAKRALARTAEIASGAAVTVVSVVYVYPQIGRAPMMIDEDEIVERRRELAEAKKILGEKGIRPRAVERRGDPAEVIVELAEKEGADLVVVGTRGQNAVERFLLGSVSSKVVHEAPCDVLVVR